MLTLAAPWWLLLVPLPWLLRRRVRPEHPVVAPRLPLRQLYPDDTLPPDGVRRAWKVPTLVLIWLLLLLALARPQWLDEEVTFAPSGRDLMMIVDLSPSMQERDMLLGRSALSRLEAVKRIGAEFIEARRGDRIGLIVFSTTAHLYAPLTLDHRTVREFLEDAFVGMAGGATAIGDALGLAVSHLRDHGRGEPVVILLTDGENNAGALTPEMATEMAVREGIRVHTIGVGGADDSYGWHQSRAAGVDERLLDHIAQQTGGEFFMGYTLPELDAIYDALNRIEPVEQSETRWTTHRDLYHWPLALALGLALAVPVLPRRHS